MDAAVHHLTAQVDQFEPEIREYVTYALDSQGKHLRPALVALSGMATGAVNEGHVSAATIVEMVHLATLVHDDVMDEAQIRRSRPTLAAQWGAHLAVLVGDCLFAQALRLAALFPTPAVCRAVSTATNTVCSGEILQDRNAGNFDISRADYFRVIQMKTGELFALSSELGGLLNSSSDAVQKALRRYGMALGTAYQIYDDCLDLFGVEGLAGKTLGSDLAKGKATLPVLLMLERASAPQRIELKARLSAWEPRDMPQLRDQLEHHHALQGSVEVLEQWLQECRLALSELPDSAGRKSLLELTTFLTSQVLLLAETSRVPAA